MSNPLLRAIAHKSNALTTRLCVQCWLFVLLLWLFIEKWPLRLPMASRPAFSYLAAGENRPKAGKLSEFGTSMKGRVKNPKETSFVNGPLVTSKLISVAEEEVLRMISLIFVISVAAVNAERNPQYPLTRWEYGNEFLEKTLRFFSTCSNKDRQLDLSTPLPPTVIRCPLNASRQYYLG